MQKKIGDIGRRRNTRLRFGMASFHCTENSFDVPKEILIFKCFNAKIRTSLARSKNITLYSTGSRAVTIFLPCMLDNLRSLHLPTLPLSLPPRLLMADILARWTAKTGLASCIATSCAFRVVHFIRCRLRRHSLFYSFLAGSRRKSRTKNLNLLMTSL
jgi:hypothetical protein